MIKLNGIDFEFPTINKLPTIGYEFEIETKKTISKREINKIIGKRTVAEWSYIWLTESQINMLFGLIELQKTEETLFCELDTPTGAFKGEAFITIANAQTRFGQNEHGEWVWSNYGISLRGRDVK